MRKEYPPTNVDRAPSCISQRCRLPAVRSTVIVLRGKYLAPSVVWSLLLVALVISASWVECCQQSAPRLSTSSSSVDVLGIRTDATEIASVRESPSTLHGTASESYSKVASIGVGNEPFAVGYDSGVGEVFVYNSASGSISVVNDTNDSTAGTINASGGYVGDFAYDSRKGEVFFTDGAQSSVLVISDRTNTVVANISIKWSPSGIAYDASRDEIFVGYSAGVGVISDANNSVIATIPIADGGGGAIAYDYGKREIYVANSLSSTVSVISDGNDSVVAMIQHLGSWTAGTYPNSLVYDAGKGEVFVANGTDVTVLNDTNNTVVALVPIPAGGAHAAAYDPAGGTVFETDSTGVSVISDSDNEVISRFGYTDAMTCVPCESLIQDVTYDSVKGEAFFIDYGINAVTVVGSSAGPAYSVSFVESGLPLKSSWSVELGGIWGRTTGTTVAFREDGGSLTFLISNSSGLIPSPSSGTVIVSTADLSESIVFSSLGSGGGSGPQGSANSGFPLGTIGLLAIVGVVLAIAIAAYIARKWRRSH